MPPLSLRLPSPSRPLLAVTALAAFAAAAARVGPAPARRAEPEAQRLPGRTLVAADGVTISARHDPCTRPGTRGQAETGFVVVHGFTGSWRRPDIRRVVRALAAHGGVVSFDLRGHGRSRGACTAGDVEVLDLDAALAWARALGYRRVVVVGFSLGAAVALRQAALATSGELPGAGGHRPDVVVAVSGPGQWYYAGTLAMRRVNQGLGTRLGRAVLRWGFATRVSAQGWTADPLPPAGAIARLAGAGVPVLLVHGDADHYFPVAHAHGLQQAALAAGADEVDVPLWVIGGMGHAEGGVDAGLVTRIARWALARAAEGTAPAGVRRAHSGA